MIPLHRLSNPNNPFYVNPDLIHAVEATPDTVLTMTNQSRIVVAEAADVVVEQIRMWRVSIFAQALGAESPSQPLAEVLPIAAGLS